MRYSPPAFAIALLFLTVSSISVSQRPDAQISPRSVAMTADARAQLASGKLDDAVSTLESALAVDPRNRPAFILLAKVSEKQGLPGKAIRFYREALLLEPNDLSALAGQGEAMVTKGALTKARENLARIRTLCVTACAEQVTLATAIDRGVSAPQVSAQAIKINPVASEGPAPKP